MYGELISKNIDCHCCETSLTLESEPFPKKHETNKTETQNETRQKNPDDQFNAHTDQSNEPCQPNKMQVII